ncbi:MAG: response regulator [Candidatus Omnitrophica bacterium]|nr:response regulator [Candidatus Omnitrophota bacterium]
MQKQVLLIDDKKLLQEYVEIFAERLYSLYTAESGLEAISLLEDKKFDAIVVDIKLPDCNGVDLVENLKTRNPEAKFLLITAYITVEGAVKAVEQGVEDYIIKPFNPDELLAAVDKVLKEEGSLRHRKLRLEEIVKTKTLLGKKLLHLDKLTKIFDGKEEKIVEFKREINFLIKRLNAGVTPDNK